MDLALRDLRRQPAKAVATVVGVGLLLTIVLVMNGIYQGNIFEGVWLVENTAADLWVVERGRGGPFNESSRLPADAWKSVAATPGVKKASPIVVYSAQREAAGTSRQFTIIGYDVFGGMGGPTRIAEGRAIMGAHYEMVADAQLGAKPGDRIRLGAHDYHVVGMVRGAVDAAGNPVAYLSLADAQEVQYAQDASAVVAARAASTRRLARAGYEGEQASRLLPLLAAPTDGINAVLVRLAPGADAAAVKEHISKWLHFSAYTSAEERALMLGGRLKKMSAVLSLFRGLLVAVSIVIIALILYVLTMEKVKSIATLKLIGAPNRVIVRMILEQSLLLTGGSFAFAFTVMSLVRDRFPRTLVVLPEETAFTFAVMMAGGVVASLMAIWRALRTPASVALGG